MKHKMGKRVAVMQPYLFPHLAYFHLIRASDQFVFYDDVNFMKRSWISRNRLLNNGRDWLMSVPLNKASQNMLIMEVPIHEELYGPWRIRTLETIRHIYHKAPHFDPVFDLVEGVIKKNQKFIADLAVDSVVSVCGYLDEDIKYFASSSVSPESRGMEKSDRLIHITKFMGSTRYLNATGGKQFYEKEYFNNQGVELSFVLPGIVAYQQFNHKFVPGLSIIDVLMFNDVANVKDLMGFYDLV